MVTDNVGQGGQFHLTFHTVEHDEAFVTFGILRTLGNGQQAVELHGNQLGVDQLILGRTGMDAAAMEHGLCTGGIEILVLNFSHRAAVSGVGIVSAELFQVEMIGTTADFLVGSESDLQGSVAHIALQQIFRCGHDFRHASLVIRTQQGGAVGDDQVLAHILLQAGIIGILHKDALFLVQADVTAAIFHNLGLDVRTGSIGRGVHVGNKANGRQRRITGNGAVNVAIFVHVGICNAHFFHFLHQYRTQNLLLGRRRAGFRKLIAHGVERNVFQKSFNHRGHIGSPC